MTDDSILRARVTAIEPMTPTLKRFIVEPEAGCVFPAAAPGAHVQLTLEGPSRRWKNAYSLTSPADQGDRYEIIVRRVEHSRGGSVFLHDAVQPGTVLTIAPPTSLFPIVNGARKHLLISAGIGLTPFLSFLPSLTHAGVPFELHHVAHVEEIKAFEALLAPFAGSRITLHPGRPSAEIRGLLSVQPLGTHLYVCGPDQFMSAVQANARAVGWPESKLHHESFGVSASGAPFAVRLARSGHEIEVGPEQSLLEALEDAGIDAPCLCRGGACGHCAITVLEGVPDHRDHVLTEAERQQGDTMMSCVSRAQSPVLVLDL